MKDFNIRKNLRLKNYDYSKNGAYFVTVCTHNRLSNLSRINVVEGFHALHEVLLSPIGLEEDASINFINEKYNCVDKYIIMPNHIHLIVKFTGDDRHGSLSLQDIIHKLKSFTTHKYNTMLDEKGVHLWQRSYHEHIIRNETAYQKIWQYIDTNPAKWEDDEYYIK